MTGTASTPQTVEWLSLAERGFEIFIAEFSESPSPAVVISGSRKVTPEEMRKLHDLGFRSIPGPKTVFARNGGMFKRSEIASVFPEVTGTRIPRAATRRRISGKNPVEHPQGTSSDRAPVSPPRPATPFDLKRGAAPSIVPSLPVSLEDIPLDMPEWKGEVDTSVLMQDEGEADAVEFANDFQARYTPASAIGPGTTMVPSNMAEPLASAFRGMRELYGDIDDLVIGALGWTMTELRNRLSPEQVDAVAVFIKGMDEEKAEILADQTGVGKGRVLAACAVAAIRRGLNVIFLTETANLFSDFWRDVMDIEAQDIIGEPYILNSREKIFDLTADEPHVLFTSRSPKKQGDVLTSGELPEGVRFCFATYSQFNRRESVKAAFLRQIANGALLIEDESHNAAGDSNIASVINSVEEMAACCLYSSATFAAKPENMRAYRKALPDFFRGQDVASVLRVGGQSLQAALAQGMTADGRLLRREHDLSGISIDVVIDTKRHALHKEYADALSPILSRMAKLSRRVSEKVDTLNEQNSEHVKRLSPKRAKDAMEKWTAGNFGGRLGLITRQFLTALKVDLCVEQSLQVLNRGDKPVIVIDITMESILRELQDAMDGAVWAGHELFGSLISIENGKAAPSFGDALSVMLRRIMTVKVRRRGDDPEEVAVLDEDLMREAAEIMALISAFPKLPLSPMDSVREALETSSKPGGGKWTVGEITGRSMRVQNGVCEPMPARNRNETVIAYNNGSLDVVFITKPGSAGLSLHASNRVKDKRRRILIEMEIPSSVVNRIQRWGRVNRRGQTSIPGFMTLATALPFEVRNMAIQNKKVEDLSAQVTANAETATLMDVPDLMNSVGNDVCKRLLHSRPQWAEAMDISLNPEDEDDLYYVNKFLFRLILLTSAQQEGLYRAVVGAYHDAIRDLAARGLSPKRGREMPGRWRLVERDIYDPGDPWDRSVFGGPVYLTTIESEFEASPMMESEVLQMIAGSREALSRQYGVNTDYFASYRARIAQERPRLLERALSRKFGTIEHALRASEMNAVKLEADRLRSLTDMLILIEPGVTLSAQNEDGELQGAVIVDVRAPSHDEAWFPGKYQVRYLFPGDEKPREISIAGMLRQEGLTVYPLRQGRDLVAYPSFRHLSAGRVMVRRKILDGNLFSSVRIGVEAGFGTNLHYLDDRGIRRQGVLIPKGREAVLPQTMRSTRVPEIAFEIMRQGRGTLWSNASRSREGVVCTRTGDTYLCSVNGDRQAIKRFSTPKIREIMGLDDRMRLEAQLPPGRTLAFLREVIALGETFYFEGSHRDIATRVAANIVIQGNRADISRSANSCASI